MGGIPPQSALCIMCITPRLMELCTFPRCSFAFKAFFRQGITGKGYYPGLAVPVRFLAALCALNTGSGSPVSGSAISVLFPVFVCGGQFFFLCGQLLILRFALVFAEIYSFAGLFTSMSNIWKVVYPITAVFNLSGYYQATALEMIVGCVVQVLCGTFRSCVKRIKIKFIERKWRCYKSRRQCNRDLHTRFSISVKILVFSLRKNQGGFVTFLFLT